MLSTATRSPPMPTAKTRPVTFGDLVSDASFPRSVDAVRTRDGGVLPRAAVDAAVRLLMHPSLRARSARMVVELQMYTDYWLAERKLMHGLQTVVHANNGLALTTSCAPYGTDVSHMRCSAESASSRIALQVARDSGRLPAARPNSSNTTWRLGGLPPSCWPAVTDELKRSVAAVSVLDFGGARVEGEEVAFTLLSDALLTNTSVGAHPICARSTRSYHFYPPPLSLSLYCHFNSLRSCQ
jgi:hypothetical protein